MTADLTFLVAGAALVLAVVLPSALRRYAVSAPLVLVAAGALLGLSPLADQLPVDPLDNRAVVEHVTELTVIIALMGVGLALDRPLTRSPRSWGPWSPAWRLLLVAMPLCIGLVAVLGWWWAGLAPAAALLLGAALAPTDPVLASDVQVAGPQVGEQASRAGEEHEVDEHDEVRFALTSEAGLNDGLAFPFVYAAVLLAGGSATGWGLEWLGFYVVAKVAIGVAVGVVVGVVAGRFAFRSPVPSLRVAEQGEPLLVLAALLTAYGVAEVAQGYGFLAVFASALALRSAERHDEYHGAMHDVVERLERLFTLLVLLVLGIALTRGVLDHLTLGGALVGAALVLVVRPATAWLALAVRPTPAGRPGWLSPPERRTVAFFGVRGVGSLYYLAYALGEAPLADLGEAVQRQLWAAVTFTVVLSVVVHGVLATPVMRRLDERLDHRRAG